MQDLRIEVDVLCDWQVEPQAYRLYINDDLYTERTYIWHNPNQWVREIIVAELAPGHHTIKIQSVDSKFPVFRLANFSINNNFQILQNGTFTV